VSKFLEAPFARRASRIAAARGACLAAAAAGVLLRVAIACRAVDVVDRLFVPDDTYYTLSIARAMAQGLGPAADGVHLTNGFQPLLAFLLVPVFALTHDPDVPLRAAWLLLALADGALALALGALARRASPVHGQLAAATATVAWAASPLAISYALGGLETSLALLLGALFTLAWCRARRLRRARDFGVAGVLAGLAVLARIDLALLVAMVGGWELARGQRGKALVAAAAGAVTVAPWWAYEIARFGTVVPASGEAVRAQVAVHRALYLTTPRQIGWAFGTVLEAPLARVVDLREWFFHHGALAAVGTALLVALVALGVRAVRGGPAAAPIRLMLAFGVVVWLFYALYVPALWFFPRYLSPMHVTLTVAGAIAVARLRDWRPRGGAPWPAVLAGSAFALAPAIASLAYVVRTPAGTVDVALHGAKGYREPARQILDQAPDGSVLGALQSGALEYYAPYQARHLTVVNLDGVVDAAAAAAFAERRLAAFARSRGVTHLVDWQFNVDVFLRASGDPRLGEDRLRTIARARPQGEDCFSLRAIDWPP
jgi:hypothetical protein